MTEVHILTQGFDTPNGAAFLRPIVYYRRALRSLDIRCRIYTQVKPDLANCDVLIIDSKYYRRAWSDGSEPILAQLGSFRNNTNRLLWFDTTDSSGAPQAAVLPVVDRYYKSQLLRDRSLYLKPLYGQRIYTDYYHHKKGITDEVPESSKPVTFEAELTKLRVSWNSALADYSRWGQTKTSIYRRFGWRLLLRPPRRWASPSMDRGVSVSSRFGISYPKATVRFQRERIRELLKETTSTVKLKRAAYFKELENSKSMVSPFGWGEITLRDFEGFLSGCVLVKPDMSHMETWPDLYQDGVTMLTHDWDMTGLTDLAADVTDNYRKYLPIAATGQQIYRSFLIGVTARDAFTRRFTAIVKEA